MEPHEIKAKRIDADGNNVRIVVAGRASYCYVFEPVLNDREKPDGPKSYMTTVLIPKDAPKEVWAILVQGLKDAIDIGIRKKWGGKKPPKLDLPINDGDIKAQADSEKYGAYAGCKHFTAKRVSEKGRPRLVAHGREVTAPGVIESGDWCVFDFNFYPFDKPMNKGVAVGLNGVTLIHEGERFGGGPSQDAIDAAALDLYGEVLTKGVGSADADDLLNSLSGGGKSTSDDLMDLLK